MLLYIRTGVKNHNNIGSSKGWEPRDRNFLGWSATGVPDSVRVPLRSPTGARGADRGQKPGLPVVTQGRDVGCGEEGGSPPQIKDKEFRPDWNTERYWFPYVFTVKDCNLRSGILLTVEDKGGRTFGRRYILPTEGTLVVRHSSGVGSTAPIRLLVFP